MKLPFIFGFSAEHLDPVLLARAAEDPANVLEAAKALASEPGRHILPSLRGPDPAAVHRIRQRYLQNLKLVFPPDVLLEQLAGELRLALMERERVEPIASHTPDTPAEITGASEDDDEPCEEDWCLCYEGDYECEDWDDWDDWDDCADGDCDHIILDPTCFYCFPLPDGGCEWEQVPCDDEGNPFLCC